MNKAQELLDEIKKIEKVDEYYTYSTHDFFKIADVEGTSILCEEEISLDKSFDVYNSRKLKIHFIPVDGKKGILGFGDSYCDSVIFSDESFSFLEFKLNATSLNPRAVRKNRKKAIEQLGNTIDFFDKKLQKDYKSIGLEAIIATPDIYPRADTGWKSLEVEFLEEYGIPLFEDTKKEY